MLAAYADGFEAMAAVTAAGHPALYDGGWHPTAVCGPIGAAVVAARLLGLRSSRRDNALAGAVLGAGGMRAAFGSDGKALQVGQAAAGGVQAALLARAGAQVDPAVIFGELGFVGVFGAPWPAGGLGVVDDGDGDGDGGVRRVAIERNWIKLHPSCLGTHSPIEAAMVALGAGFAPDAAGVEVVVHPVGRQAAHRDAVSDGLAAKFSIPYCVAFTLRHARPPAVRDFAEVDKDVSAAARAVTVVVDASLPEFGAACEAVGASSRGCRTLAAGRRTRRPRLTWPPRSPTWPPPAGWGAG